LLGADAELKDDRKWYKDDDDIGRHIDGYQVVSISTTCPAKPGVQPQRALVVLEEVSRLLRFFLYMIMCSPELESQTDASSRQ